MKKNLRNAIQPLSINSDEKKDNTTLHIEQNSFAEIEDNTTPHIEQNSFAEIEDNTTPHIEQNSFAEIEDNTTPHIEQNSFAEIEDNTTLHIEQNSFAEIEDFIDDFVVISIPSNENSKESSYQKNDMTKPNPSTVNNVSLAEHQDEPIKDISLLEKLSLVASETSLPTNEEKNLNDIVHILKQEPPIQTEKDGTIHVNLIHKAISTHFELATTHFELATTQLQKELKPAIRQHTHFEKEKKPTLPHVIPPQKQPSNLQKMCKMSLNFFRCCSTKRKPDAHKKNDDIVKPPNFPPTLTI